MAAEFDQKVGIDGVIVTKLDGDTRGGAALSVKAVTGKPILYVGMGEEAVGSGTVLSKPYGIRILGMGDVLSLIEKAEAEIDEDQAKQLTQKMKKNQFDYNDFLASTQQMKKMGGMSGILGMLPGMEHLAARD